MTLLRFLPFTTNEKQLRHNGTMSARLSPMRFHEFARLDDHYGRPTISIAIIALEFREIHRVPGRSRTPLSTSRRCDRRCESFVSSSRDGAFLQKENDNLEDRRKSR